MNTSQKPATFIYIMGTRCLSLGVTSSDGSIDPCTLEGGSTRLPLSVSPLNRFFYSLSPCSSTSPPPLILTPLYLVPNLLPAPIQLGYILTLSYTGLWQRTSITSIVQSPMAIFQFLPWHPPRPLILFNSILPYFIMWKARWDSKNSNIWSLLMGKQR